jgi:hypothetical protein
VIDANYSSRAATSPFMIPVVGEFNASKSALVNALLGEWGVRGGRDPDHCAHPTDSLRLHNRTVARRARRAGAHRAGRTADLQIVDTPGTNALNRQHERLTREFVPRADRVPFQFAFLLELRLD